MKQFAAATARNREAIGDVLERELPGAGTVLEIASGSGEHAVAFATRFPGLTWQPTDPDPTARASIAAWRAEAGLPNLAAPVALDVTSDAWPIERADAIACINMIHIAPWDATLGLFAGAARALGEGALLYLYGPYRFSGATAASNIAFEHWLKARDPRFGVRDVDAIVEVATAAGFALRATIEMPANNHSLVFRRV